MLHLYLWLIIGILFLINTNDSYKSLILENIDRGLEALGEKNYPLALTYLEEARDNGLRDPDIDRIIDLLLGQRRLKNLIREGRVPEARRELASLREKDRLQLIGEETQDLALALEKIQDQLENYEDLDLEEMDLDQGDLIRARLEAGPGFMARLLARKK